MKRKIFSILFALVLAVSFSLIPATPAMGNGTTYTIIDLGKLGEKSYATAINNSGDVVGYNCWYDPYVEHAFLWEDGVMIDLGTLFGTKSRAEDINDSGQVVGYTSAWPPTPGGDQAFLWQNDVMTGLGTLGGSKSQALGINASGEVVGSSNIASGRWHAFRWTSSGGMVELASPDPMYPEYNSWAYDINDSGLIVGRSQPWGQGLRHILLWSDGSITDLITPGTVGTPFSINDSGQVVGWANIGSYGFLWENGDLTDLGTLGGTRSYADDINASGQVVGRASTGVAYHAFLWENGVMTDLNDLLPVGSEWTLSRATGINDAGHIVGFGTNPDGETHGFLLTLAPPEVEFAQFTIDHAKLDFKKKVDDDKVRVQGTLELDLVNGNGVDISDLVTVTVGPLSETITMELKGKKGEKWQYKRPKDGEGIIIKKMTINWKNGKFDIRMDKADLNGLTDPEVTISIQIGDDFGQETIPMREKKHHWDYKAK